MTAGIIIYSNIYIYTLYNSEPIEIRHAGYPEIWRTLDILPRHLDLQQDMKCPFFLSHCVANHRHLPNVIQHF